MDEILKLYEQSKDILILKNKRNDKINKIKQMENELIQLLNEREKLYNKNSNKYDLLEQLRSIEYKIDKLAIETKKIKSIEDFEDIKNENIYEEKAKEFIDELIYEWNETDTRTVVLSKKTKNFFKKMKNKTFYKDLKKIYYGRLKKHLDKVQFSDIIVEEDVNEIYININPAIKSESNILEFYSANREISNFLFDVLMNNLEKKVYSLTTKRNKKINIFVEKNNDLLENTKYFIEDIDKYIKNVVLTVMSDISKQIRNKIEINNDIKEYNFSEDFVILLFCLKKVNSSAEIKDYFLNFFNVEKIEKGLFNYLCVFSEINYLQKKINYPELAKIKEDLFSLIIKNSGASEINYKNDLESLKMEILENHIAFTEILSFFIFEATKGAFLNYYFEFLCECIYKNILENEHINIQESEKYAELINWFFNFDEQAKHVSNICKLKCLEIILVSDLNEIEVHIDQNDLCLEKNEIRNMIVALFSESEKQNRILKKLN